MTKNKTKETDSPKKSSVDYEQLKKSKEKKEKALREQQIIKK